MAHDVVTKLKDSIQKDFKLYHDGTTMEVELGSIAAKKSTDPMATDMSTGAITTDNTTDPMATDVSTGPITTDVSTGPIATHKTTTRRFVRRRR